MGKLNLSSEERVVVAAMAASRQGALSRLSFYGSVLIPVTLFGFYGIWNRSVAALIVSLVGLGIFIAWRLGQEVSSLALYQSLFRKIAEHEAQSDQQT